MLKLNFSFCFFIAALALFSCQDKKEETFTKAIPEPTIDFTEIKVRKELKALVDYNSTSYFLYKGSPMGFEYELLSRYAKETDLALKIIPINDLSSIIDSLNEDVGDIIAANLTVTKDRQEKAAFSQPIIRTKQVLVQRANSNKDDATLFVKRVEDLIGQEVYVQKGSSFFKRILNLSDEIGGDIIIKEVAGNITTEELIGKVSKGEIPFTIADEHVAKINKAFYRNIHIKNAISLEQQIAWAVRKESPDLLISLNKWLDEFRKTTDYRVIYLKYYGNTSLFKNRVNSDLFTSKSGNISPYDDLIKKYSQVIQWDWRLLTSLIYQESQFDHSSSSWAGARGLMQLMPSTAKEYGLDSTASPEESIIAGIDYLSWLDEQFADKVTDKAERRKFVLAAYNVGLGHVFDAIRLAEKHQLKKDVWENNVAEMLLNKSKPNFYKDDVVHYGYCRGSEPYKYVNEILSRYEHYLNITEISKES